MQDFKGLKVWDKSHHLAVAIYKATSGFPKEELYGLTNPIRRCGASVPANIAEGCGRGGKADFARFLQVAMGSASELQYHLLLAHELGFLNEAEHKKFEAEVVEVKKMLVALISRVRPSGWKRGSGS